jgi:hypothetical protein
MEKDGIELDLGETGCDGKEWPMLVSNDDASFLNVMKR